MKVAKKFKLKVSPDIEITAMQYVGDKNKFYICEFLKGRPFDVQFATRTRLHMQVSLGENVYFDLHEKQWIFKNSKDEVGILKPEELKALYDPA